MKFQRKARKYKKCPRCGNKCLINQERCEECDLLFSRLSYASNKSAKKKLIHFDSDYVIYTSDLPSDVNYWKLLAYTILLGIFGGHYYYTGKYIKGILNTLSFAYLIFCTIFNQFTSQTELMFLPVGIYAFSYIVSLVYVLTKKFKVPVIIDTVKLEAEKSGIKAEYEALRQEIEQENQKISEEKKLKKQNASNKDFEKQKSKSQPEKRNQSQNRSKKNNRRKK